MCEPNGPAEWPTDATAPAGDPSAESFTMARLLRRVRQWTAVSWRLEALPDIPAPNDGDGDLVGASGVAIQDEGLAIFRIHGLRSVHMPSPPSSNVGLIWMTPVLQTGLIHVVNVLWAIGGELRPFFGHTPVSLPEGLGRRARLAP